MAIEILYAQSYMQTNGQMTVDILLKNPETGDRVVGMDVYNTDLPPKIIGPRMVACVPKNTPCFPIRYTNFPFTDPFNMYVRGCISGPNCAGPGCTTFSSFIDDNFMGEMVDFGSPGISGVPSKIFGPNAKYSTGMPPSIQATCVPPPPLPVTLNIQGVTAELSTSDLFPGNIGWTRINVTATGSGIVSVLVDDIELVSESLNPGPTPYTFTYLKMLTAGIKHICVVGKGSTGVFGNQVCTSIVIPPHVITTPGKSVIFSVVGNGQMNVEVNKVPTVTVLPGGSKSVLLKTGNQLGITMIPYIGSTLIGLCDVPQTNCQTLLYQYLDILDENVLPQRMVATFTAAPPPPPPVGEFTVSSDKTSIQSGDYVVFSGHYKTGGQKIGIHTTYGSVVNTVTNVAGDYKVGSYVTTTSTVKEKLAFYACAEGIISGICPILADTSNTIIIDVTPMKYKCSGTPDYTCIKDPAGTYADPDACRAECKAPPPPVAESTHAFVINLSPLSWANLQGLTDSLPGITTEMARAITLYGWTGWKAIESRIESGNKLVIYMREPTAVVGSVGSMRIRSLALPAIAAITAAIGLIAVWSLKFGFLILGFYIVNLLTKSVEVAKTQADTEKTRMDVVAEMCRSGAMTPEQCSEALKPPVEKGICETFGFSAVACDQAKTAVLIVGGTIGAYLLYRAIKKVTPSA